MIIVRAVLSFVLAVTLCGETAAAQSAPGADVAVQVSSLRLSDVDALSTGIGGRLTVDLARWIALDGEFTFVPKDNLALNSTVGNAGTAGLTYHRRRTDGFVGVKVGRRLDRVGFFAKARPGLSRLVDKGVACSGEVCALLLIARPDYQTEFVFDLGAVVELYPTDRWLARVDVGNTFIRHRGIAPPCTGCTSSNLSATFGLGVRF